MFMDLKREIQEEKSSYSLIGKVESIARADSNVFVLLYAKRDEGLQLEGFTLPDDTGIFSFIVNHGTYQLVAFEDKNANRRHDPGEPTGAWGKPDDVVVHKGPKTEARKAALTNFVFILDSRSFPVRGVTTSIKNVEFASASLIKLGQLVDWYDPIFDEKHGSTGFWKPMTFLKQHGTGIYFLAPYDRNKIPILFVHGASGTPREWKQLADSLDNRRFQPWVFYYPSGLRLTSVSTILNEMVKQLQIDYGFDRMGVVAHSMGGLVSRSFILKHMVEDGKGTVKVFVSFSTPWRGIATAAKGVEHAPEAIPSWYDVEPKSDFIKQIYADSLKPTIPHYLFFGYLGDCSLFMANSDGTIEILSQLDMRAQDDAVFVRGLNEDHMSILESKRSSDYLNMAFESVF